MVRSSSWSTMLGTHAHAVPATEYLSVLLALRSTPMRLALARIIQHERVDAVNTLTELEIPKPIADVLVALGATDPSFGSLPSVIDGAIDGAVQSKRGTALRIEVAQELDASHWQQLLDGLRSQLPEPLVVDVMINPTLIGGGRVQVGSRRIDVSTQTQLTRLRQLVQS